jgi:PmbA protein
MGATTHWETLPEQLLDLAQQAGAEAAEVFQSRAASQPVYFEANRLKQLESNQVEGTALRLWFNGQPGIAVAHGPIDAKALVDKALAISHINPPEPIAMIAGRPRRYPDVGAAVSVAQLVQWGEAAIAQIRQVYPEIICQAELECDVETTRVVNSRGLDYSYSDTTLSGYLSAERVRGDDFLSVGDGQTRRGSLDIQTLTQQVLQRLAWAEHNTPGAPGAGAGAVHRQSRRYALGHSAGRPQR